MSGSARIMVLNGPNLDLLGTRETQIYGRETLEDICSGVRQRASDLDLDVDFVQSNHEGALIEAVHRAMDGTAAIIVNAGGLTHTSIALMDALKAYRGVVVEVHLSNVHRREPYRHHSFVAEAASGQICGFGGHGYILALDAIHRLLGRAP